MAKNLDKKKKLGFSLLATLTSISVLLGNSFDSPEELLKQYGETPSDIVKELKSYSISEQSQTKENRFKRIIYSIPIRIRMIICVPLWFVGNGLLILFNFFLQSIISPMSHIILGFILQNLILLAIIAIGVKVLFPNLPLRKIFSLKIILIVLIGSILTSALDIVLSRFWNNYSFYKNMVRLIIGLFILTIVMKPFVKKKMENLYSYEIQYKID